MHPAETGGRSLLVTLPWKVTLMHCQNHILRIGLLLLALLTLSPVVGCAGTSSAPHAQHDGNMDHAQPGGGMGGMHGGTGGGM